MTATHSALGRHDDDLTEKGHSVRGGENTLGRIDRDAVFLEMVEHCAYVSFMFLLVV